MIHDTAEIHPTAIVEDGAKVGARTVVMEFAIIRACVEVGKDCEIRERVILGALPVSYVRSRAQWERLQPLFGVEVGDRVHFHTSATVVRGMKRDTRIGDDSILGQQVTIGHDSIIGKMNMITNHSTLGGGTITGDRVRLNLNVTVREETKIGYYALIGMGSNVTKDVKANSVNYGNPCKFIRNREPPIKSVARRIRDIVS